MQTGQNMYVEVYLNPEQNLTFRLICPGKSEFLLSKKSIILSITDRIPNECDENAKIRPLYGPQRHREATVKW